MERTMPPSKNNLSSKTAKQAVTATATLPARTEPVPLQVAAEEATSARQANADVIVPEALTGEDAIARYKTLYETLGRAYWEASDLHSKDTIQGAREAVYEILTDLNIAKLKANTAAYVALMTKVTDANCALETIRRDIGTITKNITTAASVITAVTRVLDIVAMV
jgi:hypothetical protein